MGLTLVTGDRNAGKTGQLYRRAREAANAAASVLVLVPSIPERERAAKEFGADFPTRIAVETLDAFLGELWEQWGDGRRIVREAERLVLLEDALERSRDAWAERLSLAAMRRVLPTLVRRASERSPISRLSPPSDPLAAALVSAVQAYERVLDERGLIEPAWAHALAAAAVPASGLPDVVCVNRFETFTPPQEEFLAAASEKTDLIVALTYVPGSPATAAVNALAARLAALADSVSRADSKPMDTEPELASLQEALSRGGSRADADGAVVLAGVDGSRGEAETAAAMVEEMVETGISTDDIAIVAPRIDHRILAVAEALEARGVPWRYEGTWRFRDSGFGRSVLALLRFARDGRREDLAAVVQGGYAGVTPEEADEFLRFVRGRRPAHGDETWSLAVRAPGAAGRMLAAVAAVRRGGFAIEHAHVLHRVADEMLVARYGAVPVLDLSGRLDARCRQKMLEAAAAVAECRGRLDPDALLRVLGQMSVTVEDDGHGVVISSPERIRARRFDGLLVLGLQSDEFPRSDAESGLPRKTVEALAAAGIDARPRTNIDAERLLFYQTVTAARRRLVLLWQERDDKGRERERSLFLDEVIEAYRRAPTVRAGDEVEHAEALETQREARVRRADPEPADAGVEWDDGALGSDLREALSRRTAFAAGELETYLCCPRLWFFRHVVKAEGLDAEIDARYKGRVAHAIVQRFYERWQEMGISRVHAADVPKALELHAEIAESVAAGGAAPESLQEKANLQRAVQGSRIIIMRDARSFPGFKPVFHELVLSDQEPWTDFGAWKLKGRVDRVDVGERGLIVCDYKSKTDRRYSWQRFRSDGVLQAPLYAAAVSRLLDRPVAGVIYRAMSSSGKDRGAYLEDAVESPWLVQGDAVDAGGLAEIVADAVQRASEAVEGIRSGRIPCEPLGDESCKHCPARTWCGRAAT